jgi:hypothetical protein
METRQLNGYSLLPAGQLSWEEAAMARLSKERSPTDLNY